MGRRAGADSGLPPILVGSHIDSVPNAGNFDGPLGTMAALEVLRTLGERGVSTAHPIEVVIWTNEEGVAFGHGLCGSRAAAGEFPAAELDQVWSGMTMADAIRKIGGDPARLADARRPRGSIHAYLELHIEQSGTLDPAGAAIGVVEGIVAIDRYEAVISGAANHAGTTPMADRHWKHLPTHTEWQHDQRFRAALLHLLSETWTGTLPLDTYPIRISLDSVTPGTLLCMTKSHCGIIGHVSLGGSQAHPLQTWEAMLPVKVRKLVLRNFISTRPESKPRTGLVKFRWPVLAIGGWKYLPVQEHPFYSEEQYTSRFYEGCGYFSEALAKKIDLTHCEPMEKMVNVIIHS